MRYSAVPPVTSYDGWPTSTLEKVLLPEPFGPMIACTSPRFTWKLMPLRIALSSTEAHRSFTSSSISPASMVGETPARLVLALDLVGVEGGAKPEEPTMNDNIRRELYVAEGFLDLAWSSRGGQLAPTLAPLTVKFEPLTARPPTW